MKNNLFRAVMAALFVMTFMPALLSAEEKSAVSVKSMEAFPVLREGRVKPLSTYAQNVLLQFSGRREFNRKSALDWLARLIFDSASTRDDKVFLINNPEVAQALGITPETHRRYSFSQMEKSFHKLEELATSASQVDEKKRSAVENELPRLANAVDLYMQLSVSLSFAVPREEFTIRDSSVAAYLELPEGQKQFNFLDIAKKADLIQKITEPLQTKPKSSWSGFEKEIVRLTENLFQASMRYKDLPFTIIPSNVTADENWISPWDAITVGFQDDSMRKEVTWLGDLAQAYRAENQIEFDLAARKFSSSIENRLPNAQTQAVHLEVLNNKLNLLLYASAFYLLTLFALMFSFGINKKIIYDIGFGALIIGFALHVLALAFRVMILHRPPVSSLYETFIFVGSIGVLMGILVELMDRRWLGIMTGGICGYALLLIAGKFSVDGDTLKMLVAVLNSNFWLTIHVLTITMGYAGCCAAGVVGHVFLIQALLKPKNEKALLSTYRTVLGILGFGLTLSALGTTMGGIWADQSWGRFWGWDPKENGALMIVLWCSIIFHAKVARWIGPIGVAAGSVLGMVAVSWAWFGVNLLSVGLHSYGFTSGIALGLSSYVAGEVIFLLIIVPLVQVKLKNSVSLKSLV